MSDINDRFFDVTGYRSMIIAPISGESGPLGALEVYSTEAGAFDDADAARHPLARRTRPRSRSRTPG